MNLTFAYVALIYFGAVYLSKRAVPELTWRVAIYFYSLVLGFLFLPMVGPYVNVPVDFIYSFFPWSGMLNGPSIAVNFAAGAELNDIPTQIVPWAHQVREAWRHLQVPLWNSAAGGGYPLLANGQSAAFSLFRLLALPLPLAESLTCESALKILTALTFAFLYLRNRYATLPSVIGATMFGFSTFTVVWLSYPMTAVAVLLPALFFGIDRVVERRTYRRFLFLAAIFTFLIYNGHPENAALVVLGGGLYVAWRMAFAENRASSKSVMTIVTAGIVALMLTAPFTLPFLEAVPRSQRIEQIESKNVRPLDRSDPSFLVPLFDAGFFGTVRNENRWGAGHAELLCGFAGILGLVGWSGMAVDVFARRRWRSTEAFFVFATPLAVGILLGIPGIADAFHALPLFSYIATTRLRLLFVWFVSVLATAAIDLAVRGDRRPLAWGTALAAVAIALAFALVSFPGREAAIIAVNATKPRLVVLATLALLLMSTRSRARLALVAGAAVVDLWAFGYSWNPIVSKENFFAPTPLVEALQARSRYPDPRVPTPFRIAGTNSMFFQNSAAMYGLEDIRAHDPMANGPFLDMMRLFCDYTSSEYFGFLRNPDVPFIDFVNVAYLVTPPHESYKTDRFEEIYSGPDGKLYRNRWVLPRFFAVRNVLVEFDRNKRLQRMQENQDWSNTVIVERIHTSLVEKVRHDLLDPRPANAPLARVDIRKVSDRQYDLDIDAPRWTLIASSQPEWPGWHIYRDKKRLVVIEVNSGFLGFIVPPGKSHVRVVYEPRSFSSGLYIAGGMLLMLIAPLLRRRR